MFIGIERSLAHLFDQGAPGKPCAEIHPHNQGVDKQPDQPFHRRLGAPGNGRADENIMLTAIALEQQGKDAKQRHKGGGLLLLAKVIELACRCLVDGKGQGLAAKALLGRARAVGGQFKQWRRAL